MPSDRDRFSYEASRQYRSVVAQQGRVTVPADWNEAQEIFAEEQRREMLDIVGPAGTPDDGYRVDIPQPSADFDFLVSQGTMYVGGERVFLPRQIRYFAQPDWIDAPAPDPSPVLEFIYLQLQEQEVSAVEDSSLREVALGGPDTTQRTRLLQHIVRAATKATTCPGALADQVQAWLAQGLVFDPATMRLRSMARLKAGFDPSGPPPDPCEPSASGGYLGAENQLIRVRVTAPGELVWGFDDASFLYRVDVIDNQTLKFQTPPVDSFHQPRVNQAIEILRSEAQLSNGEYIAYDLGRVDTLAAAYNADTQTITLPTPLTAEFLPPSGTPRLFVRVWEQKLEFVASTPVTLGNTGVQVTLTLDSGKAAGAFHPGDFWALAVRPATPVEVYPHRYLDAPQPPEGPRLWVCPLAVLSWSSIAGTSGNTVTGERIADCRQPFDDLVELTKPKAGCCVLSLRPEDLVKTPLQAIVDRFSGKAQVTICFAPGQYQLPAPLVLTAQHSGITLEGCHAEVSITAAPGAEAKFLDGMFVLNRAADVTLRGLSFHLPLAPLTGALIAGLAASDLVQRLNGPDASTISAGIGVRVASSANTAVEACSFSLQPPPPGVSAFEAAILISGVCSGLTICNNVFQHAGEALEVNNANGVFGARFGVTMIPSTVVAAVTLTAGTAAPVFSARGAVFRSVLNDAAIMNNLFTGLSAAAFLYGEIGAIRIERNTVRNCASGIWALSSHTIAGASQVLGSSDGTKALADAFAADPVLLRGSTLARGYPLPGGFKPSADETVIVPPTPFNPNVPPNLQLTGPDARGFVLNALESAMEEAAFSKVASQVQFSVMAAGNQVDAISINSTTGAAVSLTAMLVWAGQEPLSAALLNSNECRSVGSAAVSLPTTMVLFVSRGSITGNLIANEGLPTGGQGVSLIVTSTGIAITGNALKGARVVPARPGLAPPFNTWDILNAILT